MKSVENFDNINSVDCLVVGAGISGIAFAYHATQKGLNYKIIERDESFGGVWHHAHFPNLTTE